MTNLTKVADGIEGLSDRQINAGGFKFTFASVFSIFVFISTVVGGLYGGFVLYQKVEEVAGLDLGEYQQAMDVMDAKVSGISTKVEESVEYTRDIKNGLRDDILGIEKQADRVEDTVRSIEDTVATLLREHEANIRTLIDAADVRFESQRDRLRTSQDAEMKQLEARLSQKLQRALDNPLAD